MGDEVIEIHGTCAPGFEPVRQAFAANFAERGEIGASVAVVAGGEPVVNLWAGWANPARTQAWQQDTLTNVWSTTKAVTSLCAHVLMSELALAAGAMTGERARYGGEGPEEFVLHPTDGSGDHFAFRSRWRTWIPVTFGQLADQAPYLFTGGRITLRADSG